jgi:hypothetical protein
MHSVVDFVFCLENLLELKVVMSVSQCIKIDISIVSSILKLAETQFHLT